LHILGIRGVNDCDRRGLTHVGEVSTEVMQKVAREFQTFTDDVIFLFSDEVK